MRIENRLTSWANQRLLILCHLPISLKFSSSLFLLETYLRAFNTISNQCRLNEVKMNR